MYKIIVQHKAVCNLNILQITVSLLNSVEITIYHEITSVVYTPMKTISQGLTLTEREVFVNVI
jgi:hypothetical protein